MAYVGKNPRFNSAILLDEAGTPANPPASNTKIITRSGALYLRNSAGSETQVLTGSAATQYAAKSADYTITDTDNFKVIGMTTSNTTRTVTFPTAADNTHRILTVVKEDSGTGFVTLDGEGAETLAGAATRTLIGQYDYMTFICTGTAWTLIDAGFGLVPTTYTPTSTWSSNVTHTGLWQRKSLTQVEFTHHLAITGTPTTATLKSILPNSWTINTSFVLNTTANVEHFGTVNGLDASASDFIPIGYMCYDATDRLTARYHQQDTTWLRGQDVTQAVPAAWANLDKIILKFTVPISGI